MKRFYTLLMAAAGILSVQGADLVTSVSMESDGMARVKEQVSGSNLKIYGRHTDENMPGAVGKALRFDGYSTFVEGVLPEFNPEGVSSFSIWVAPETYPVVMEDQPTTEKITLAGTIDHSSRSGWAFSMGKNGEYSFDCYAGGWLASAEASDIIPPYEWSHIVAVNDPGSGTLSLFRNGEKTGEVKSLGALGNGKNNLVIGKTADASGNPYLVKSFNGLIDDVNVYDGLLSDNELNATPENPADLSIPESRFAKDLLRPKYHGMPGANWTNETHGMTFSDGLYHVFFQKNANGPYMTRLHWGHLTSPNLYDWTEEKIALAPGEDYDIKGTWSGCVFTDPEITGDKPGIIYTGVDYVKAYIAQASPLDNSLVDWEKDGVIINGRPSGLSDDFRDPYFFRNGDDAYIIVGTSKNNIGATTLHKYNQASRTWSNDGNIFFAGTSAAQDGTFWEMPNITKMENGKWLFTTTPQNTSKGVHTLYWTGEINSDGTFKADSDKPLDLELINGQGYGLLSPTIYQKDGKTILMGIVPDKLPLTENCELGWAHLYSFPREISIDASGNLLQKPFSGLQGLRNPKGYEEGAFSLDGAKKLTGVGGRQFEIEGVFTVGGNPFGFNILKGEQGGATITYSPANNKLEVNLSKLSRKNNDRNSFNGYYSANLPEVPEKGSEFKLHVFFDGSILDLFVNDRWASSIRIFPTASNNSDHVEVFSVDGAVNVKSLKGWLLGDSAYTDDGNDYTGGNNENPGNGNGEENEDTTGIEELLQDLPEYVDVYNSSGMLLKRNVRSSDAIAGLSKGIYIIGGRKILL